MSYQINSELDTDFWAVEYAIDSRCRIQNILQTKSAQAMHEDIAGNAEFRQAHISSDQYREISREEFARLDSSGRTALVRDVYSKAARGVGFWYGRHGLDSRTRPPLDAIFQWLNSAATLQVVREVSGIAELVCASAQITSFAPGDFLTRHRDDVVQEGRRVAFVLNLTEQWHPDWGGLLQFFAENGDTRDAWSPLFNSLCLFDVKHIHSVTCVAPFAPKVRLAISGWFHDQPQE